MLFKSILEKAFNKAFNANIMYLTLLGLWPATGIFGNAVFYRVRLYINIILGIMYGIGLGGYVVCSFIGIYVFELTVVIENVGTVLFTFVGTFSYAFFLLEQKKIEKFINELNNFTTFEKPDDFQKINRYLNYFSSLYVLYAFVGAIYYCNLSISDCKAKTKQGLVHHPCDLVVPLWFPFNYDHDVMFKYQIIFSAVFSATSCGVFAFVVTICMNLILRIQKLKLLIGSSLNGENYDMKLKRLAHCVNYHNFVLRITKTFDDVFAPVFFILVTLFSLALALIAFQFTLEQTEKALVHLFGWFIALALVCYFGQLVINESDSLTDSIYNILWYKEKTNIQKIIQLMMIGCHKSMCITGAKTVTLSFTTLRAILSNTYSVVAVLNIAIEDDE